MKPKLPVLVTILVFIVLTYTALNAVRFVAALQDWETLTMLGVSPSPLYIVLTGLFWSVTGLGLNFGLLAGHPKAKLAAQVIVPLYAGYYWFERLALQNAVARENMPFALVATFLVVFYTIITLNLPISEEYFKVRSYGKS
jgi:hypothetical protein